MNATMNWGKWKWPIVGWAGAAIALWALLYGFYWHDRTGRQIFWGDAIVDWIGDVVMLQWVINYQTLVGGVLALIGGGAVVWSALAQRQWAVADTIASRAEATLSAITAMRIGFQRVYNELTTLTETPEMMVPGWERERQNRLIEAIEDLEDQILDVAHLGTIAELLQFATSTMRDKVRSVSIDGWPEEHRVAAGIAAAVGAYLMDGSRLIGPAGRAEHKKSQQMDLITSVLSRLRFTPKQFGPKFPTLAAMFDFDGWEK
jgi:hypothetical protein